MNERIELRLQPKYLDALIIIFDLLKYQNITWSLTGSVSHCIQGVNISPRDLDIITTKSGGKIINLILEKYIKQKISYIESDKIRSYFGTMMINSVRVEVFAEIENRMVDNIWESHIDWDKNITIVSIRNRQIPVLSLEYEYLIYSKLNKFRRADLILNAIRRLPIL